MWGAERLSRCLALSRARPCLRSRWPHRDAAWGGEIGRRGAHLAGTILHLSSRRGERERDEQRPSSGKRDMLCRAEFCEITAALQFATKGRRDSRVSRSSPVCLATAALERCRSRPYYRGLPEQNDACLVNAELATEDQSHEASLDRRSDRRRARVCRTGLGAAYRPRRGRSHWDRSGCQSPRGAGPFLSAFQSAGGVSRHTRYAGVAVPRIRARGDSASWDGPWTWGDNIGGTAGAPACTGFNAPPRTEGTSAVGNDRNHGEPTEPGRADPRGGG